MKNCPVCQSADVKIIGRVRNQSIDALYCKKCDTVFPSQFPSKSDLVEYYSGFTTGLQQGSNLREKTAAFYAKKKSTVILKKIRKYSAVEKVLDFGGGNGYFSKGFYLNGVSVDLYDIDKKSMAVAKKKGINIINHIDPIPRYDLVFSSHVIEHCVDLNQFIAQAIAPLKMGGILAICCPNKNANEFYRYFHCRRYRDQIESASVSETTKQWFCFDPPRHLYAISQNTLKVLAKSHGLELLELFTEYLRTANFHSGDLPLPFLIKPLMKNWRLMSDTILSVCFSRVMTLSHGRCGDSLVAIMRKSG